MSETLTTLQMDGIKLPAGYEIDPDPELITPPKGTYFIRALKNWNPRMGAAVSSETSISLQIDKKTLPLRSYGYILNVDKGAVIRAYDKDVTSELDEEGKRVPATRSTLSDAKQHSGQYTEENLDVLCEKTKDGAHNELIVRGGMVEISGCFIVEGTEKEPGLAKFRNDCLAKKLKIHIIPKISPKQTDK